jgi:tetratricopeptide (TPR) repeat protein
MRVAQAEGYLLAGRLNDAAIRAQQALDRARHTGAQGAEAVALWLVAEALAGDASSDRESAAGHYQAALALAEPRGMRPLVAHCHLGLGRLLRVTGETGQARRHLAVAATIYREIDVPYWLERAEAEMNRLIQAR